MENTNIRCPHCKSEDTIAMYNRDYKSQFGTFVAGFRSPKRFQYHTIASHICLDCGIVFISEEDRQKIKRIRKEES